MSLVDRALNPITTPELRNLLTCHVATWYWAAQEAAARGLTTAKTPMVRAGNIGTMPGSPQGAMLALPRLRSWDFSKLGMPAPGMVMLWTSGSTHTAVSTPAGITGYNQACIFAPFITTSGYTKGVPTQLQLAARTCFLISPETVVAAAGRANL